MVHECIATIVAFFHLQDWLIDNLDTCLPVSCWIYQTYHIRIS